MFKAACMSPIFDYRLTQDIKAMGQIQAIG